MTEGEMTMPLANLALALETQLIHPGTSIIAEVKLKNTSKSVLQVTDEPFTYANQFEIALPGEEKNLKLISAKIALDSRAGDDRAPGKPATLSFQPDEENVDRENIASYLPEGLKPGQWKIRAGRSLNSKDQLHSEWKSFEVTPWQISLASLRFDPQGQHWQTTHLNKESDGHSKLWVRYSSGSHPATGTFKDWTETLEAGNPNTPEPNNISSIAFAQLFSSTSEEWMLIKEGDNLHALKSSGEPVEICHGKIMDGDKIELLESGIAVDKGERAVFVGIGLSKANEPKLHFFKVGDGKVIEIGSSSLGNVKPEHIDLSWSYKEGTASASIALSNHTNNGTAFWIQEIRLNLTASSVSAGQAIQVWKDARKCISMEWDRAHLPQAKNPGLAFLFSTNDSRTLELIHMIPGKSPQHRSIVLSPGMKPESVSLSTQADGQWAITLVSGGGIFYQKPGKDTWILLAQEKGNIHILRSARIVGGAVWTAWVSDTRGLRWASAEIKP